MWGGGEKLIDNQGEAGRRVVNAESVRGRRPRPPVIYFYFVFNDLFFEILFLFRIQWFIFF